MQNIVALEGRLTRDPEGKYGKNETLVSRFSVACQRDFKQNGEYVSDFFNVVAFGKTAEFVQKYLTKGRLISLEGRLALNTWEKEGEKRSTVEIHANNVRGLDKAPEGSKPSGRDDEKHIEDRVDPWADE